ncbi:hypothetical protein Kpol_526p17 [Vanderwaltozyma polyspora DSM 70294]|uniref:Mid2 domain-containing protein n=1 Tax=Vanderwaltozyma polyspora (strain ATCC 22028 / DSM 70294 / BCRC 21397 / CBS 2163 / NBRC 10782 / NRRL Y-8283 / UCD 57-17) TaxID=436907 RepID=A7TLS2_VANPO|nr:uncharacterized protein Kpol_526p17 [Vanderwaltozyma polyspora DSM 70294]EDO16764.1 hypothetical protein Kpol_526p17 [Vanderwaltozyma polyspora DSM 70294]
MNQVGLLKSIPYLLFFIVYPVKVSSIDLSPAFHVNSSTPTVEAHSATSIQYSYITPDVYSYSISLTNDIFSTSKSHADSSYQSDLINTVAKSSSENGILIRTTTTTLTSTSFEYSSVMVYTTTITYDSITIPYPESSSDLFSSQITPSTLTTSTLSELSSDSVSTIDAFAYLTSSESTPSFNSYQYLTYSTESSLNLATTINSIQTSSLISTSTYPLHSSIKSTINTPKSSNVVLTSSNFESDSLSPSVTSTELDTDSLQVTPTPSETTESLSSDSDYSSSSWDDDTDSYLMTPTSKITTITSVISGHTVLSNHYTTITYSATASNNAAATHGQGLSTKNRNIIIGCVVGIGVPFLISIGVIIFTCCLRNKRNDFIDSDGKVVTTYNPNIFATWWRKLVGKNTDNDLYESPIPFENSPPPFNSREDEMVLDSAYDNHFLDRDGGFISGYALGSERHSRNPTDLRSSTLYSSSQEEITTGNNTHELMMEEEKYYNDNDNENNK